MSMPSMKKVVIAGVLALGLIFWVLTISRQNRRSSVQSRVAPAAATAVLAPPDSAVASSSGAHHGFLYGHITTVDGATYAGRLRWGGSEEAFWGNYFNGFKDENPWAGHVPSEELTERRPIEIFGFKIADREHQIDLGRPFMARFGDISRIEAQSRDIRVTLKSGTTFDLDRRSADDLADGLRVWDAEYGVLDFHEGRLRIIEFLPAPPQGTGPKRLHGTVRTTQGDFTGFVQWNRRECVVTDTLDGETATGERSLPFDTIRSIARDSNESSRVTLVSNEEIVLSGTRDAGHGNRGIYVDDPRFGRVLISWSAFERIDFSPSGSGPAYGDFPPGRLLRGSVTTFDGETFAGRLVFDLDESETTETLDAPSQGVHYTIPFGLIASIKPPGHGEGGAPRVSVTLHGGEELQLEHSGDLGEGNPGLLIFANGGEAAQHVPWSDVERVNFRRPSLMYPPLNPGVDALRRRQGDS